VISGVLATMLAIFVIVTVGESRVILGGCSGPLVTAISGRVLHSTPQVCTPVSPWSWALPVATVIGAAAGGFGTCWLLRRHRGQMGSTLIVR
jgi:hypothetical protein